MSKYKILFTDLDGTLINTISGNKFPKGIWDMYLRFAVLNKIKELAPEYVFIVSNQGGIEKGFVNEHHFCSKLDFIIHSIEEYCDIPVDYYYCSSNDLGNFNRKPNFGMLQKALSDYLLDEYNNLMYDKSEMLMIGDTNDFDKKTAENFGIAYLDVNDFCKTNFND